MHNIEYNRQVMMMRITRYRQILEESDINIPGLMLFGHNISQNAVSPMATHIHKDCLEFVAIIKGNECYSVEDESFELTGGNVFISHIDQPHGSGYSVQGVCEFIWFQINALIEKDFLGLSAPFGQMLKSELLNLDTHVIKTDKENISLLKKSFENFMKPGSQNRLHAISLFVSFLSKLLLNRNHSGRDDELMKNIISYIDENIFEYIRFEDICMKYNISLSGFKHKFKEYTGVTPRSYINEKKIKKAEEMLKSGKSVTETAMLLSFNTSSYFSVMYKKYMGLSPSGTGKSSGTDQ